MIHPLLPKLRQLKLSGMALTLDTRAAQAAQGQLAPSEFLALLLDDELERRDQCRLARRFQESGCDEHKTLAGFDFLPRHENILICGPTGVGKSHLANGIACAALKQEHHVLSRSTHRLLADLQAARATGAYQRLWARVLGCDLLLLDDFGLQPLTSQAVQDLYEIISERYERRSVIVTSNRAFEEWADVFNDALLASAALDRLTHHAHTLTIRGDSYRQTRRRKEEPGNTSALPAPSP